jgi:hypothetical protein
MTQQRMGSVAWILVVALAACGPEAEGIDPQTGEGVEVVKQSLVVNDLYAKLREVEGLLATPPPSATIAVGTLNAANGTFTGLSTSYMIDPITRKPRAMTPFVSLNGLDAIAVFTVVNGNGLTVTANGQTVTSVTNTVSVNLGRATRVNWTLQSGQWNRSDTFTISRPEVIGAGAFTVAALPVSIVYEPPMNAARSNSASIGFRQEMTTVTTVSNGSGSSSAPKWATGIVMKDILDRLSKHWKPAAAVKTALSVGKTLMGSVDSTTTSGTTVNSDSSLGLTQVSAQTITTNARLGPGRGDIIVFYKDARVVWGMEQGNVTLTLIDHGPLAMVTVDTLLNELAAARAGQPAPVTGLDVATLESLIKLDPQASLSARPLSQAVFNGAPVLMSPRFTKDTSLVLSGTTFQNSISHTVTQTDKTSTLNTTSTVKNYHPGWLSVIGIGQTKAGTFSTTVSMGSSRSDSVSSTVSASFSLSAAAGESYSVDVHYDSIFGSFLTRHPPLPPLVLSTLGGGLSR